MGKPTLYETIFSRLYNSVDQMVENRKVQDNERNHVCYGAAVAYAVVLREMGHAVELGVYEKEGYLLTDKITVDGKGFDFFHA